MATVTAEPAVTRALCDCGQIVIVALVRCERVIADFREWEPRATCQTCQRTRRAHPGRPVSCARCGNTGMVGKRRSRDERMLAIDVAWSDDEPLHVRLIGPRTPRRAGESLHVLHDCRSSYGCAG